jgi:hypothetical protein
VAVRLPPEEVPPLTILHLVAESNVAGGTKSHERAQEIDVKSCFGGCNSNSMIDFFNVPLCSFNFT